MGSEMCIRDSMIAVMQFGEWGVEASEAIRVTDQGAELFCNMSKELHVKS